MQYTVEEQEASNSATALASAKSGRTYSRTTNQRSLKTLMRTKGVAKSVSIQRSLGNEKRLAIMYLLNDGEKSVLDLAASLDLRQPTVSQQLARLREDKLVTTRREGQTIYYSIADSSTAELLDFLAELYGK